MSQPTIEAILEHARADVLIKLAAVKCGAAAAQLLAPVPDDVKGRIEAIEMAIDTLHEEFGDTWIAELADELRNPKPVQVASDDQPF